MNTGNSGREYARMTVIFICRVQATLNVATERISLAIPTKMMGPGNVSYWNVGREWAHFAFFGHFWENEDLNQNSASNSFYTLQFYCLCEQIRVWPQKTAEFDLNVMQIFQKKFLEMWPFYWVF